MKKILLALIFCAAVAIRMRVGVMDGMAWLAIEGVAITACPLIDGGNQATTTALPLVQFRRHSHLCLL